MRNNVDRLQSLETTDTVLEHLQTHAPDNLTVYIGDARYLVPVSTLKLLAWNSVPPMIRDESSEEAKKNQTLRTALKALIRPVLPDIIKKSWGREVKIVPRMNILNWLPRYLINILINVVSSLEWEVYVEKCDSCEGSVFKVIGISPYTNHIISTESLPASRTDSESVRGRGELDAPRAADSDESRGSMGNRWSASFREIDVFEGTNNKP